MRHYLTVKVSQTDVLLFFSQFTGSLRQAEAFVPGRLQRQLIEELGSKPQTSCLQTPNGSSRFSNLSVA